MSEVLYNKEQIKELIPHREPFLLIDEINEMEPGKRSATAFQGTDPESERGRAVSGRHVCG